MQKIAAGKFHLEPPFTSFDHLVGAILTLPKDGQAEGVELLLRNPITGRRRLLRARRERPLCRSATECCDKVASPHGLALRPTAAPYHTGCTLCITARSGCRCPSRVIRVDIGMSALSSAIHNTG